MVEFEVSNNLSGSACRTVMRNQHWAIFLVMESISSGVKHAVVIDRDTGYITPKEDFIEGTENSVRVRKDLDVSEDAIVFYSHQEHVDYPLSDRDIKLAFSLENNINTVCALSPRETHEDDLIGIRIDCAKKTANLSEEDIQVFNKTIEDREDGRRPAVVEMFGDYCSHYFTGNIGNEMYPVTQKVNIGRREK